MPSQTVALPALALKKKCFLLPFEIKVPQWHRLNQCKHTYVQKKCCDSYHKSKTCVSDCSLCCAKLNYRNTTVTKQNPSPASSVWYNIYKTKKINFDHWNWNWSWNLTLTFNLTNVPTKVQHRAAWFYLPGAVFQQWEAMRPLTMVVFPL